MTQHIKWLAIPLLIGALTSVAPAAAQTMSFADAADALVAACGRDIETHCKNVNLGGGKMKACLNSPKVQAGCKSTAAQVFTSLEKRAQARIDVLTLCDADAARLCRGVQRGDGQVLECMILARRAVSPRCNQAITDAGYR